VDNDCYVVLGNFTELPKKKIRDDVERQVRDILAAQVPVYETIDHTTLNLAKYRETTLELKNTDAWDLDKISAQEMASLYPEAE
jgi:hypothetical protein